MEKLTVATMAGIGLFIAVFAGGLCTIVYLVRQRRLRREDEDGRNEDGFRVQHTG